MTESTEKPQSPDQILTTLYQNPNYNPGAVGEVLHHWLVAKGIGDIRNLLPLYRARTYAEFWRELKKKAKLRHDNESFPINFKNEVKLEYLARLDQ